MFRRIVRVFLLLALLAFSHARVSGHDPAASSATLELLLPEGATATADGKAIAAPRAATITDLSPNQIRRVKVAVKFTDGTADERLVDVAAGQRLRIAIPPPGPETATVIGSHPLVPINAAAVSANGKFIALGLDARTVVVWDTSVGKPVRTLVGHQKPVLAVAFSPDGKSLLSGSGDTTAILWDVETGTPLRTCKGHKGAILSVAFAPDGKRFLSGSADKQAVVWETETAEQVHQLSCRREILGVAYSPDGGTLATSSSDATAALWDAKTGKQIVVLRGHREDANCVAFSPDGRRVVTGSSDDTSIIWDARTGSQLLRGGRHTNNVHAVAFTPDGRRFISGEREELVMMWDAATGANARTFAGHGAEIFSIVPCLDGRAFLTASRDGTARLWDLSTGRELLCLTTNANGRAWAAISADGLLDGSEEGRRALGYRFPKGGFGEAEQFFDAGYRPGLLAEVWRGERPFPTVPPGRGKPPAVKLTLSKDRSTGQSATVIATVTDRGGGLSGPVVENNGVRLNVPTQAEPSRDGQSTRYTLTVPLAPGSNRIDVRSSTRDGSRQSAATEMELSHPQMPGRRGRLYVIAVGTGESQKRDAESLAKTLQTRGGKLFERVDVVPIFGNEATRAAIEDAVRDVAELSRPQDALVVLMCGAAVRVGDRVYFAPHDHRTNPTQPEDAIRKQCVAVGDIAAAMGTAPALSRALVVDATATGAPSGHAPERRSEFGFRGVVERWSRANGIHTLVAIRTSDGVHELPRSTGGSLFRSLLESVGPEKVDVSEWFQIAAGRAASPQSKLAHIQLEISNRRTSFPILGPGK